MSMAQSQSDTFTTLSVRKSVVERLKESRPYDSMSWNDFLVEMADVYEQQN